MVDPATLAVSSIAGSAGGSGISAIGSIFSGQAQSQMYQYQSAIALANAQIAETNVGYALSTGEQQARQYGMKAAQTMGGIRAAQGANGIDVGSGSSVDVRNSQRLETSIDLNAIRTNAARVAYGYQTQEAQDITQSQLYSTAASTSKTAGLIGAAGSLVSGAGSVSDKWLQAQSSGALPGWGDSSGTVGGTGGGLGGLY